jgi:hypothetical protein
VTIRVSLYASVLVALVVPQVYAPPARPVGDLNLLPPDGFLGTWKRLDSPRVFARDDLYGYIDGGAELFFEFGFERLTQQKYQSGRSQVAIDFYRMTDPTAATGIYLMKCGKETPAAALGDRNTVNRYQLMFVRDRFFVIVNNVSGAEALAPEVVRFASFVASKLPASPPVTVLHQLPQAGLVRDSQRVIRGPYALQSVFTLGDGDILQLGGRVTAVAANYSDADRGSWTRIEVTYPSPAAASAAMAYLQGHLDPYLTAVSKTPARLVFRDFEKKFGVVSIEAARMSVLVRLRDAPPAGGK